MPGDRPVCGSSESTGLGDLESLRLRPPRRSWLEAEVIINSLAEAQLAAEIALSRLDAHVTE